MRDAMIAATAELIRIPSINPDLVPGAAGERELAEAIAARLQRTPGIAVELQDAGEGIGFGPVDGSRVVEPEVFEELLALEHHRDAGCGEHVVNTAAAASVERFLAQ